MTADLAGDAVRDTVIRQGYVARRLLHADRGSQLRIRAMPREPRRRDMAGSVGHVGAVGDNIAMEMLLYESRGDFGDLQEPKDVAWVETLETSHSFPLRLSFCDSARDVFLGGLVNFGADEDSLMEDAVELSISAA